MQPNQTEYIILDKSVLNKIAKKGYASIEDHYGIWKDDRQFFLWNLICQVIQMK